VIVVHRLLKHRIVEITSIADYLLATQRCVDELNVSHMVAAAPALSPAAHAAQGCVPIPELASTDYLCGWHEAIQANIDTLARLADEVTAAFQVT